MAVVWYVPKKVHQSDYRTRVNKYSGLQPDLYYTFVNEMEIYNRSQDPKHLYQALETLEELALYVKTGSTGITEEIWLLIHDIANQEEEKLLRSALERGVHFAPKYLKEYPPIQ